MRNFWLVIILSLISIPTYAQSFNVTGRVVDITDNSPLIGVIVTIAPVSDTTQRSGTASDADGAFTLPGVAAGSYLVQLNYIGFQQQTRTISVAGDIDLGTISMRILSTTLQNVVVTGEQLRAQQRGDTTNFNAGAFKTNPDANAEDLITKMPGLSTEGGTLKANGEDVRRVLVDGKPFFGDDPNAAIKNLPAEIIDRIQVFDRLSDQAQLTGVSDGNDERTINIITRPGRNTGQFGKIFGGLGLSEMNRSDLLYQGGGNVNFFNGARRISLIALSNNINQQNFSTEDLMGVVNQSAGGQSGGPRSAGGGGGMRGGGGPQGGGRGSSGGGDRGGRGGSDAGNFLIGQQAGITTTHSFGLNYSDEWAKNMKVSGSYFFNNTSNDRVSSVARTIFHDDPDSNLIYKEISTTNTKNTNHRANLRLEYEIDSFNTLIVTPRISIQQNNFTRMVQGNTKYPDSSLLNSIDNRNISNNMGYSLGGNIGYRRRFGKRGRSLSLNLSSNINDRAGDGLTNSVNFYDDIDGSGTDSILIQDQRYDLNSRTATYSGNITYTEPLNERSQIMANYSPSISNSESDRETKERSNNGEYDQLIPQLSNKFDNTYITQRGGLTYRYNDEKTNFNAGVDYQSARLEGNQVFPEITEVNKKFSNFLPSAMLNYRFTRTKNLRLMYRTNTNAPSISQLQNVYDVTNPLLIRTGNPELSQDYQHTLMLRYGNTNTTRSTSFFMMAFANFVQNYIGNASFIFDEPVLISEGILLNEGAQITMPVNLDGYWSARTFATYGMPVRAIKSNLNMNLGFNYNRIPAIINNENNLANNYTVNGGLVLSSNISEAVDFTIAYSGYYNVVRNSLQTSANNNYYNQNTSLRFNWLHQQRIVVNTTVNHTLYSGLSQGFNQSFVLWNAGVGYKFLKDRSLDVRLNVYDILNQNRAIDRTVTETYIEDSYTNVLQRYFMLNLTYTLRRFGGGGAARADDAPIGDETAPVPPQGGGRRGNRDGGQ